MSALIYRRAAKADLPAIISLLADDVLGSSREATQSRETQRYSDAFAEIDADPNQFLCVVEDAGRTVGTLQLTIIPGLARNGTKRGQIEAVRIARDRRGEKLGEAMIAWAVTECHTRGCSLVQLTTDNARQDAQRFYVRMGFVASHVGYKMSL